MHPCTGAFIHMQSPVDFSYINYLKDKGRKLLHLKKSDLFVLS